jgi:dolichyl-phosphate-mannose-protein mannosyltransferase
MTARQYLPLTDAPVVEERGITSSNSIVLTFHALVGTIILLFAAFLRIPEMNRLSLWFDDAWVALIARMSASQLTHIGMTAFGFDAILWGWFKLVGFTEVSAKLIPFVAGCLAPVAVYAMVIRKGLGWIPGIVAALILVVAPADVQYAATVKQYTMEALLTVLLIWLAWTVLEDPRRKNVVWLGAVACVSVAVSAMTVFVAVPAFCIPTAWTALKHRERRFDCIIVAAVTLAFIGVWISLMAVDATNPALRSYWSSYYVVRANGISGMAVSSLGLAEHFAYGLIHRRFVFVAIGVVAATILALRRRPVLISILWFPIVFVYLASLIGRAPFGGGRTDIFLHPLLAVLAALAIEEGFCLLARSSKSWHKYLGYLAVAAIIIVVVKDARPAFPNHPNEDFRPLARRVIEQKREGDVVIVDPGARYEWFLYSAQPFSILPGGKRPNAFPYTMEAKDTVVLDDYPYTKDADGTVVLEDYPPRANNAGYASGIDRAMRAQRIWLVASHLGYVKCRNRRSETEGIEEDLQKGGYDLEQKEERSRAFVELWIRSNQKK